MALGFRIGHTRQKIKETIGRVHIDQVRAHLVPEDLDDLLGLALAKEAVVHMHADQVLTDRADEQRGDNRRIHAAGERQKNLLVAHLCTDLFYLLLDKRLRQLRRRDTRHLRRPNISGHKLPPL